MNPKTLAAIARKITGGIHYRKRLPAALGGARIYVTSRSDIRLLFPGFGKSAADLLVVAEKYIRPGHHVWDIGSNLGIFSFCSAWKAGRCGSVHTLEADPFFAEIQHKTSRCLPTGYAQVKPLCAAASNRMGLLELSIPKNGMARNHLAILEGNSAEEAESQKLVVTVTGDFLLNAWPRPHFVKVDVEGAEAMFLEGASKLLHEARPVFYIEVNPENQEKVTEIFQSCDYQFFSLSREGTEQSESGCVFNTIAKPRELL